MIMIDAIIKPYIYMGVSYVYIYISMCILVSNIITMNNKWLTWDSGSERYNNWCKLQYLIDN